MLGLVLVPVSWPSSGRSMPKRSAWPPWRSISQLLERLSLVLIVGGVRVRDEYGILTSDYLNPITFYPGHFYGAWALHWRGCRSCRRQVRRHGARPALEAHADRVADRTREYPSEPLDGGLVAPEPAPPTISRRGILALVGGTSLAVFVLTAGETIGGVMRNFALFGTHYGHRIRGESLPGEQDRRIGGDHRVEKPVPTGASSSLGHAESLLVGGGRIPRHRRSPGRGPAEWRGHGIKG